MYASGLVDMLMADMPECAGQKQLSVSIIFYQIRSGCLRLRPDKGMNCQKAFSRRSCSTWNGFAKPTIHLTEKMANAACFFLP